jgi:DNA-binding response OmpR family regulator
MNDGTALASDRLLIVDDQRLFAELIANVAKMAGFATEVAVTADEFLEKVDTFKPTVMTIDLLMPEADGIELLRALAARNCVAQILVISGFDKRVLQTAQVLGRELGLKISGTIAKPIRAADLRKTLEALKG